MQRRLLLPLLALVAAVLAAGLALPGGAHAKSRYKVGMGDQSFQVFDNANFKTLKIRQVRLIVPWDWDAKASDPPAIDAWLKAAHGDRKRVLVAFGAHRGCFDGGRYSKRKVCRPPSAKRYTRAFKRFRKAYPFVKQFQPWNEVNSKSQPTYKRPTATAKYFIAMKRACRSCNVLAADLLDSSNLVSYTKRVKRVIDRAARKHRYLRPRVWGLHNYSDVNRHRTRMTRRFLKVVRGQVWLTETGGLVRFLPHFKTSDKRAARSVRFMFRLANAYSKQRRGYRSRITRVYPYSFFGYAVAPGQRPKRPRFDSGLVGPLLLDAGFNAGPGSGKARPAYRVFRRYARSKSK